MLPARLRGLFNRAPPKDEDAPASQPESIADTGIFYPSLWDVLKVRYLLQWKAYQQSLPAELVDAIVDAAEYWPSTERRMEGIKRIIAKDRDQVLLKTVPLCHDRKVCFSYPLWPTWTPADMLYYTEPRTIGALETTSSSHATPLSQDCLSYFVPRPGSRANTGEYVRKFLDLVRYGGDTCCSHEEHVCQRHRAGAIEQ